MQLGGGCLCGSVVEHLPLAKDLILGSRDGVQHQTPRWEPFSPSCLCLCLSLCVSHEKINKIFKKKKVSSCLLLALKMKEKGHEPRNVAASAR